ncbi:MAG: hypothetical protein MJ239_00945 [Bacilli bacterium]|nr:hypothetical protein [Bacilli bacterium]
MDSREFNSMLLNRFPNIKGSFDKETSWQDGIDTGSIVVLEDVFMPYFLACFEKKISEELSDIYSFIEECVTSSDQYCKDVIEVGVIENIYSYDIRDELSLMLLPKSKESYLLVVNSAQK